MHTIETIGIEPAMAMNIDTNANDSDCIIESFKWDYAKRKKFKEEIGDNERLKFFQNLNVYDNKENNQIDNQQQQLENKENSIGNGNAKNHQPTLNCVCKYFFVTFLNKKKQSYFFCHCLLFTQPNKT